jgi:hypothetical protein
VHCANARARKESCNGLPGHREVYGDGIAFFHAKFLEDVGYARYLAEEFGVCDLTTFTWLICFVDDRSL